MQAMTPSSTGAATQSSAGASHSIILVYAGDHSVGALLLDIVKKTMGREDCALCEITHSPLGKRAAWRQCEARLNVRVDELHRDELPDAWRLSRVELPCVLGRVRDEVPFILVSRSEIEACGGQASALTARIQSALAGRAFP